MLAVDDYSADIVEDAVNGFIKGTAPGVNANFLPPPPVLGAECTRLLNIERRREELERRYRPVLPPPPIVHDPDSQARVGELVKKAVENLQSVDEKSDTEADKRRDEMWEKVNRRFRPDMSDEAIYQRLMVTSMGFEAGDDKEARDD